MDQGYFDALHLWLQGNIVWVGPVIALVACLESLAVIGIVLPGVAMLFALGAIAGAGDISVWGVLIWAFAGAVIGDAVSFLLGAHYHDRLRGVWPFRTNPEWLNRGETFFQRYGAFSVVIGRFVGLVRPVIPMVAGMMGMRAVWFYAINILSAVAWAPVYLLPGYLTGAALQNHGLIPDQLVMIMKYLVAATILVPAVLIYLDKTIRPSRVLYFIVLAILIGLLIFANVVGSIEAVNQSVFTWLAPLYQPWVVSSMKWVTLISSTPFLVVLIGSTLIWQFFNRQPLQVIPMVACGLLMTGSVWVIKVLVDSTRPVLAMGLEPYSFPSGHTTGITFVIIWMIGTLTARSAFRYQALLSSIGVFVFVLEGLSRLFLHVHWFGDVTTGILLGVFWGLLAIFWQNKALRHP